MTEFRSLSLSLSDDRDSAENLLFLEQKAFSPFAGKLTKGGMVTGFLSWVLPREYEEPGNTCGGSSGIFTATIYAYLYLQTLNYSIDTSYGSLGERVVEDITYTEGVQLSLKDRVDFSYPNEEIISTEWVGAVYNSRGETIPKPSFTADNRTLYFSEKVYGYLKVKYKITRHRYSAIVSGRNIKDATITEDKYTSTVFAVYDGGIDWIQVQSPYGFEDFDGECGNGVILDTTPDDSPNAPPTASPDDKDIFIDYCTQEIRS